MDRRSFLKAVFAASVAPASCVKALYTPERGLQGGALVIYNSMVDARFLADVDLEKVARETKELVDASEDDRSCVVQLGGRK